MSAGLAFVARMLLAARLYGLAISDPRRCSLDGHIVAAGKLVDGDLEMHLALAAQQQFVCFPALLERQRGILLDNLVQRAGKLDLIVAVLGCQGEPEYR